MEPLAMPLLASSEQKDNYTPTTLTSTQPIQEDNTHVEGQKPLTPYGSILPSEEEEIVVGDTATHTTTSHSKAQNHHGIWNQLQRLFRPPQQ